jgi:methionyl-tRNA formyltransferase
VFFGAVHEAVPAFQAVLGSAAARVVGLVTYDDDLAARTSGFADLAAVADKHKIPVLRTGDASGAQALAWVRELAPDLAVCAGWTQLLDPAVLAIPAQGTVGFHASLLPRNRGHAPISWAILRGEAVTGCTMLMLAPELGTGDIVDQREIPIEPDDTCATVLDKVAEAAAGMLRQHLPALLRGSAPRRPQVIHSFERMLPSRTPGMGITSFDRTSTEVHNWIRALTHPCPGAFAYLRGERLMLWRAEEVPHRGITPIPPGAVLGVDGDGVLVTTRTGAVRLLEVQAEDGPPEPAPTWFERKGLRPGCVFDTVDPATQAWAEGRGPRPGSPPPVLPEQRSGSHETGRTR